MEKGKILVNYLDIFTCKTCLLLKFVDLKFVFPQENGGLRFDLKKKPHFQTFLSFPLKGSPLRMNLQNVSALRGMLRLESSFEICSPESGFWNDHSYRALNIILIAQTTSENSPRQFNFYFLYRACHHLLILISLNVAYQTRDQFFSSVSITLIFKWQSVTLTNSFRGEG